MLTERLAQGLNAVDERLVAETVTDVALLADAGRHIVGAGGKRVRPQLALLAYEAVGGENMAEVVAMAAAVELVHTATLVHDDINDHSLTRRGQATVHSEWGRTFALLTGDYLFARVYAMMAPYGARLNEIMSSACVRLVEGETLQAMAAKAGKMDRETYKTIIARKTASLFEAAAEMGGLLGGADVSQANALREFGFNLGIAFQIVDDILDLVGDPEKLGKPAGLDIVQQRGIAMAAQNGHTNGAVHAVANGAEAPVLEIDNSVERLLAAARSSGAVELAQNQAQESAERARLALHRIPASEARDELEGLIDFVLARQS